jgi:hypothetical protein
VTTETPKKKSASIDLEGKAARDYDVMEKHVTDTLPGIKPNRADVLRHALHIAAEKVAAG